MEDPIRCTCGIVIGNIFNSFRKRLETGLPVEEILDDFNIQKSCCRTRFFGLSNAPERYWRGVVAQQIRDDVTRYKRDKETGQIVEDTAGILQKDIDKILGDLPKDVDVKVNMKEYEKERDTKARETPAEILQFTRFKFKVPVRNYTEISEEEITKKVYKKEKRVKFELDERFENLEKPQEVEVINVSYASLTSGMWQDFHWFVGIPVNISTKLLTQTFPFNFIEIKLPTLQGKSTTRSIRNEKGIKVSNIIDTINGFYSNKLKSEYIFGIFTKLKFTEQYANLLYYSNQGLDGGDILSWQNKKLEELSVEDFSVVSDKLTLSNVRGKSNCKVESFTKEDDDKYKLNFESVDIRLAEGTKRFIGKRITDVKEDENNVIIFFDGKKDDKIIITSFMIYGFGCNTDNFKVIKKILIGSRFEGAIYSHDITGNKNNPIFLLDKYIIVPSEWAIYVKGKYFIAFPFYEKDVIQDIDYSVEGMEPFEIKSSEKEKVQSSEKEKKQSSRKEQEEEGKRTITKKKSTKKEVNEEESEEEGKRTVTKKKSTKKEVNEEESEGEGKRTITKKSTRKESGRKTSEKKSAKKSDKPNVVMPEIRYVENPPLKNFEDALFDGKFLTVVKYNKKDCIKCGRLAAPFEKLANDMENEEIMFYSIDIDFEEYQQSELIKSISKTPSIFLYKNGEEVAHLDNPSIPSIKSLIKEQK